MREATARNALADFPRPPRCASNCNEFPDPTFDTFFFSPAIGLVGRRNPVLMSSPRAILFGFSFRHHGRHTAFHGLASALSDQEVIDMTPPWPSWTPHPLEWRLNWRWLYYSEYRLLPIYRSPKRRIIHHYFSENTMLRAWKWKRHHVLVATCHQPLERILEKNGDIKREWYRRSLETCDAVIVQTRGDVEAFASALNIPKPDYIPLGVDCEFFSPSTEQGPTENRHLVLTVGNWLRDYQTWAQAVRLVIAKRKDIEFVVVANKDTLARVGQLLGDCPSQIQFLSGISDEALRNLYRKATLFFLPLHSAMGNDALLEALSCGCAIIVTDLPATRDYAGNAACYVPKGDAEIAAQAILALVNDRERRQLLSATGRQRALDSFDWPRLAEAHRKLYAYLANRFGLTA